MITKKIETLCKAKGISISALEKALSFGNSTIAKWEHSSPTVAKLKAVADYFGCKVDDLLEE